MISGLKAIIATGIAVILLYFASVYLDHTKRLEIYEQRINEVLQKKKLK